MKIATWNVNSIRTRQLHVINWLNENSIDVLCLQETKVIDKDFPRESFEELGYHVYIYGQKAYNGVAIFSRQPMTDIITGFTDVVGEEITQNFDEQKRIISGVIDDIRIINVYVPNGASIGSEKYEYKLQWFQVLKAYLEKLLEKESRELCICGDFNIALEDKDIYNSKGKEKHIMSSPIERETLQNILAIGLKDAFRKFTTEEGHFSWWDYRSGGFQRNRGWRIDHLYLTDKLYEKAINCTIDIEPRKQEKPSDHTPVILEI
ncbi:MAG: exodeoxyribonuclease III [Crocosphaera sp.]